jgi:hypothetical protein
MYFDHLHSLVSFSFFLPHPTDPLYDSLPFTFMSHYHHHHHPFTVRFHKWVRICSSWPFELGLVIQHDDFKFYSFSCKWHDFIFLYLWVVFHGVCISYFLYSCTSCWAPHLIQQFGFYEKSGSKHRYAHISLVCCFLFLCIYAQEWYGRVRVGQFLVSGGTSIQIYMVVVPICIPNSSIW